MPNIDDLFEAIHSNNITAVENIILQNSTLLNDMVTTPYWTTHARMGPGWTPLNIATFLERAKITNLLIDMGAEVETDEIEYINELLIGYNHTNSPVYIIDNLLMGLSNLFTEVSV